MNHRLLATRLKLTTAATIGLGVCSVAIAAVGLGPIEVRSYLGQPLNATIRVDGLQSSAVQGGSIRLASKENYEARGVKRLPSHEQLQFSLTSGGGAHQINISSSNEISEPFVNFLLTMNAGGEEITREYAVFLNPDPVSNTGITFTEPVEAEFDAPVVEVGTEPAQITITKPTVEPVAEQVTITPINLQIQPASAESEGWGGTGSLASSATQDSNQHHETAVENGSTNDHSYGPVKPGETLYSIANETRPANVSVNKMMNAIFRANRSAFSSRSLDSLMAGYTLIIPDLSEIETKPSVKPEIPASEIQEQEVTTTETTTDAIATTETIETQQLDDTLDEVTEAEIREAPELEVEPADSIETQTEIVSEIETEVAQENIAEADATIVEETEAQVAEVESDAIDETTLESQKAEPIEISEDVKIIETEPSEQTEAGITPTVESETTEVGENALSNELILDDADTVMVSDSATTLSDSERIAKLKAERLAEPVVQVVEELTDNKTEIGQAVILSDDERMAKEIEVMKARTLQQMAEATLPQTTNTAEKVEPIIGGEVGTGVTASDDTSTTLALAQTTDNETEETSITTVSSITNPQEENKDDSMDSELMEILIKVFGIIIGGVVLLVGLFTWLRKRSGRTSKISIADSRKKQDTGAIRFDEPDNKQARNDTADDDSNLSEELVSKLQEIDSLLETETETPSQEITVDSEKGDVKRSIEEADLASLADFALENEDKKQTESSDGLDLFTANTSTAMPTATTEEEIGASIEENLSDNNVNIEFQPAGKTSASTMFDDNIEITDSMEFELVDEVKAEIAENAEESVDMFDDSVEITDSMEFELVDEVKAEITESAEESVDMFDDNVEITDSMEFDLPDEVKVETTNVVEEAFDIFDDNVEITDSMEFEVTEDADFIAKSKSAVKEDSLDLFTNEFEIETEEIDTVETSDIDSEFDDLFALSDNSDFERADVSQKADDRVDNNDGFGDTIFSSEATADNALKSEKVTARTITALDESESMEINLDLANSFIVTGNGDRAKLWLDEVVALGNEKQKARAKDLLAKIAKDI